MQHTGLMQTPIWQYKKMHRYTSYLYILLHAIPGYIPDAPEADHHAPARTRSGSLGR